SIPAPSTPSTTTRVPPATTRRRPISPGADARLLRGAFGRAAEGGVGNDGRDSPSTAGNILSTGGQVPSAPGAGAAGAFLGSQRLDQRSCGAQEAAVAAEGADELGSERKTALACEQRQRHGGQAAQRPQGTERGIAGGTEPLGGDARSGRRHDRVVGVENIGEACGGGLSLGPRVRVVGPARAPAPRRPPADCL